MKSEIKQEQDGSYTLSVNLKLEGSMLEMEEHIQEMVNELGLKAALEALRKFDADGTPIQLKGQTLTSKGAKKKVPNAIRARRNRTPGLSIQPGRTSLYPIGKRWPYHRQSHATFCQNAELEICQHGWRTGL